MKPRAGVTLLEVLTAMFIMAIGMLALLTLFPLGAINMAQALRDDRVASAAHNAANLAAAMNLRQDSNWYPTWYNQSPSGATLPNSYTGPGFPIFVDAYGVAENLGDIQAPPIQANTPNPIIHRARPSWLDTAAMQGQLAAAEDRWFCLLDDITFTGTGTPAPFNPPVGPIDRAGKFTWSYLLQPAAHNSGSAVKLSVVVYSGRNIGSLNSETAAAVAAGTGLAGTTSITISQLTNVLSPTDVESPRRGGWILDTTANANGVPQAFFYQVINVDPTGTTIDVQSPLKANMTSFVIMNDVYFVAEKGTALYP